MAAIRRLLRRVSPLVGVARECVHDRRDDRGGG